MIIIYSVTFIKKKKKETIVFLLLDCKSKLTL